MAAEKVSDELWEEFHRVVNMTSRELNEWNRTRSATEDAEPFPDQAGTSLGHRVAAVLAKRRTDLTDDDVVVMRDVVEAIRQARGDEPEPTAGDDAWRHRLMSLGHDPLKP